MDEDDFRRLVKEEAPTLLLQEAPQESFDAACRFFAAAKRLTREAVPECVRLVAHFEAFRRGLQDQPVARPASAATVTPPPSPGLQWTVDRLSRQVRPWVEAVRQEVFGARQAPFARPEDAEAWLHGEVNRYLGDSPDAERRGFHVGVWFFEPAEAPRREGWGAEEESRLSVLLRVIKGGLREALERASVPGGPTALLRAILDGPLAVLEARTREIAEATGFAEADVLADLLCGTPPTQPSLRLTIQQSFTPLPVGRGTVARAQVAMTVYTRDLALSDFKHVYRAIRQQLLLTKARPITEQDREFLALVDRLGGVPAGKGQKKRLWEQVRQELARPAYRAQGFPHYKQWRCVRAKYMRLMKRGARIL